MTMTNGDLRGDALTSQGRAGLAVYMLMVDEQGLTAAELTRSLSYTSRWSVYDLIEKISLTVPLYYDPASGRYKIDRSPPD